MPSRKASRSASRRAIATSARRYLAVPSARDAADLLPHIAACRRDRPKVCVQFLDAVERGGNDGCAGPNVHHSVQVPLFAARARIDCGGGDAGPYGDVVQPWWKNILVRRKGRAPRPKLLAAPLSRITFTESGLSRACFPSYCLVFRRWL